ncbi:MAG: hypothetical protein IAI49_03680 [Candidatus Eremiobacteraeota bacterium]|nr:hypothetical protein [Candidatus Eremiobacteraeota bacterium]
MALKRWTLLTVLVAAIFFAIAVSRAVYELTSPSWLSWHVLLRKSYSIVAFAIVGYLGRRALGEWGRAGKTVATCVLGVAAYSAAIEVAQYVHGSREGLVWNAIDTLCGALGGALATVDLSLRRVRS